MLRSKAALFTLIVTRFTSGLVLGMCCGPRSADPESVPTVIEVWRPSGLDGPHAPVVLAPCHIAHNGEPVYNALGDGAVPPWRVVLVYGANRTAVTAHPVSP